MKEEKLISKERYKQRIQICLGCELYEKKLNRCKSCGCFLILKAILRDTKCPEGKWQDDLENTKK